MLRRVVANIHRQDWTAVVVELVVVVLGVFIGLQASNWNEDREKNHKAAEFTARLNADLCVEACNYETQIGYFNQVLANATRVADALGLAPHAVAAGVATLRKDPRFVALLQLRVADIETDLGYMTVYLDPYLREPLRRLVKEKP